MTGLRAELNDVRSELGGVAYLSAEIVELTATLHRSQIPEEVPEPLVKVQEREIGEDMSADSLVPQDPV